MLNKKYIKYYIFGYLNTYFSAISFSYTPLEGTFKQCRLKSALRYLGLKDINIFWLSPIFSITEAVFATLLVFFRALLIIPKCLFSRRDSHQGRLFLAGLIVTSFRLKTLLKVLNPSYNVCTLKIPFIKNDYHENEVNILSVITILDVCRSLMASWQTIWILYHKYRKRDPLFRSYSSFEYYLTCCFVGRTEKNNHFVYYNTYDRWAFLMCNTPESIFIQHGKLPVFLKLIKVGTPHCAYYLNLRQGMILERILFKNVPSQVDYRPSIEFTYNHILLHNGKINVLIVCWNNNIKKEREICELLSEKCNLYIKPHPGDKDNPEYLKMAEQYHCIIIPKTGYPKVDVVVSYDSTLADEYEDVNVKVIRYDLLSSLKDLKDLI